MEHRVTNLKIINCVIENVSTVCFQLRSVIIRFDFLNKLPHGFTLKLLVVCQTNSVAAFNHVFRFIDLQRKIGSPIMSSSRLLTLVTVGYREFVEKGEWNGNKKGDILVCFKCDKNEDASTDCPDNKTKNDKGIKGWTHIKPSGGVFYY